MSQQPLKLKHPPIPKFSLNPVKPKSLKDPSLLNMVEIPQIMLWVKEDPFLFGVLSPCPCSKLSLTMLSKVAEYCRSRSGSKSKSNGQGYKYSPYLSYHGWGHISKYKLQLPVELSWAIIRAFHLLTDGSWKTLKDKVKVKRDIWDNKFEEIRFRAEDPDQDLKLDTLQFLLFLYLQNFARLQNKFSQNKVPSFDEHWPGSGGGLSRPSTAASACSTRAKKTIAEHGHSRFVEGHLQEILEYLNLVFSKPKEDTDGGGGRIPLQVVAALSLILGVASLNGNPTDTEFTSLDAAVTAIPGVAKAVDFRKDGDSGSGTVDKNRFILWVKTNLKLNPWGPTSAAVPQHAVEYLSGIWSQKRTSESNRIFWNTQLYPKGWVLISTVNSQVLYLNSVKAFSSLKIHRCSNSYIYIPGAFSSILVDKCDNCTLFLGPAGKFVKFVDCSNLRVSSVGRFFIFQDVSKSNFNILTPIHPLICGNKGRKKVILGPYNSFYPQLEKDMELVGLGSKIQKFNRPLELDAGGLPVNLSAPEAGVTPAFATMRSEAFTRLVFPFAMEGKTGKNPVQLPRNYARSLHSVDGVGLAFKNELVKADLNEEQKLQLNAIVQARFHAWLKKQGHLDQVMGLRSLGASVRNGNGSGTNATILEMKESLWEEIKRLSRAGRRISRRSSVGDASSPSRKRSFSDNEELDEELNPGRSLSLLKSSIFFLDESDTDAFEDEDQGQSKGQGRLKEGPEQKKESRKSGKIRSESKSPRCPRMELDNGLLWSPIF